jgi:CheY-like chemotaxis protein
MAHGGQLVIELENVVIEEEEITNNPQRQAGDFVRLRVSDTGSGMKPAVRARVFEPCFTTKGMGQGAGIGLTLVLSVVNQLHGWVDFDSHVNRGSHFDLYFPRYGAETLSEAAVDTSQKVHAATPVLLLCDADRMVREVGRRILEGEGYQVILAADGVQAIAKYQQAKSRIDLVILDLNIPRLSAHSVLERLLEFDPNVRVLFSGGFFAEDLTSFHGHTMGVVAKPYRRQELVEMTRRALAAPPTRRDKETA